MESIVTNAEPQQTAALTIDQALQQAIGNHQAGRLQEAERLYRAILQTQPNHPDANHNLGVLAVQVEQPAAGLPHFKAALESNPNHDQFWLSYIDALIQTGQTDAAQLVLEQGRQRGLSGEAVEALAVRFEELSGSKPSSQEINTLASLFNEEKYAEAETLAQTITARFPLHGFGWKVLSASLQMQGKDSLPEAQKAAELLPDDAWTHSNLGNAQRDIGRLDDAVVSYRRALEINPDFAEAHSNLANILHDLGRFDDAVASYRRALEIKPEFSYAHSNLGVALRDIGQLDSAVASCRQALEIKPDYAEGHVNLGLALYGLHQLDNALASYRRALQIKPDYAEAHLNLGVTLQDLGRLDDAVASCRRALEIKPDFVEAHSNLLFVHCYLADLPDAMLLAEARRFGEMVARQARPYTDWDNIPSPDRCLRVGLVSGDLRSHPVGYFAEGMLAALASHASGRLELIAYPSHFLSDALTERIKANCHGWHSAVGLSDERLARQIREDGIDILIDLSGHTAHNRLPVFAWKPAPVQVSWLGYFATTGVAAMDYLIADPWTVPKAGEANFTEKIWRLPETRLCFTPPDVDVDVSALPALANGYVTFGCFNNLSKMNDDVVALWARVLRSIPGSRLLLKATQLEEASVRQNTIERFGVHGIRMDRLILEGFEPRDTYLAAYHRVDIALDPFPFPGGTTSVEGLWMGVPVLTLAGESFLARQGVGILMNAGIPEWIASDADDYVTRAIAHATDLQGLAKLRNGLRQQVLASPIFDAPRFARHFEAALRSMWQGWCDEQKSIKGKFL